MVEDMVATYEPDMIVVEDFAGKGSRRCSRVQGLIGDIQKLAAKRKI